METFRFATVERTLVTVFLPNRWATAVIELYCFQGENYPYGHGRAGKPVLQLHRMTSAVIADTTLPSGALRDAVHAHLDAHAVRVRVAGNFSRPRERIGGNGAR